MYEMRCCLQCRWSWCRSSRWLRIIFRVLKRWFFAFSKAIVFCAFQSESLTAYAELGDDGRQRSPLAFKIQAYEGCSASPWSTMKLDEAQGTFKTYIFLRYKNQLPPIQGVWKGSVAAEEQLWWLRAVLPGLDGLPRHIVYPSWYVQHVLYQTLIIMYYRNICRTKMLYINM